jgi:hypothetical protein
MCHNGVALEGKRIQNTAGKGATVRDVPKSNVQRPSAQLRRSINLNPTTPSRMATAFSSLPNKKVYE